jgi:hypothetical protein
MVSDSEPYARISRARPDGWHTCRTRGAQNTARQGRGTNAEPLQLWFWKGCGCGEMCWHQEAEGAAHSLAVVVRVGCDRGGRGILCQGLGVRSGVGPLATQPSTAPTHQKALVGGARGWQQGPRPSFGPSDVCRVTTGVRRGGFQTRPYVCTCPRWTERRAWRQQGTTRCRFHEPPQVACAQPSGLPRCTSARGTRRCQGAQMVDLCTRIWALFAASSMAPREPEQPNRWDMVA